MCGFFLNQAAELVATAISDADTVFSCGLHTVFTRTWDSISPLGRLYITK